MDESAGADRWVRPVPNALSGLRLLLAGLFPLSTTAWRVPVVLAGAVTDWLDGFVARRWSVQSPAGGILDAVADKAFALSVLLTLAGEGQVAVAQILLVLVRDLVVAVVALHYALTRQWVAFTGMPSRLPGKTATVLLFLWFFVLVLPGAGPWRQPLFAGAAAASVLAGADYLVLFVRALLRPPGRAKGDRPGPQTRTAEGPPGPPGGR